jgi:hypothetical protein
MKSELYENVNAEITSLKTWSICHTREDCTIYERDGC